MSNKLVSAAKSLPKYTQRDSAVITATRVRHDKAKVPLCYILNTHCINNIHFHKDILHVSLHTP